MNRASREFQVMVKPVGALCNLACTYCYYLKKRHLYPTTESFRMSDDLLESYIVQHIEACPQDLTFFAWHGGEPTLLGLDYFQRIVEIQRRHRPSGRTIVNGIQTNGTLLDDEWCRFLAREKFQVGISIDGPSKLHDCYRVTKAGAPSHKQVMRCFRLMKKHGIHCDVLCVVHSKNVDHPAAVYRFFKEIGVEFLQFLPLVVRTGVETSPESVFPEAYGTFLCSVFDDWVRHDLGRITVQNFDEAIRPFLGVDHALCVFKETCGNVVVVEHNGDLYSCDHFVEPDHRIGNIREAPLLQMLEGAALRKFGQNKKDGLANCCRECEVLSSCNGGCPKDRFALSPDGQAYRSYLCAGYKKFFVHSRPYLRKLASLVQSGAPTERLKEILRIEDEATSNQIRRNDPCPCGSGRKYKKCCLGKIAPEATEV
ncbi:MAG: anaerobic sulfatase maturase [Alphaproteobacteria bacterium]|nr:anaerobic sulfatase maturase [Alphaproteobacteria bacterium]